ncbi:MAG TPA: DUF1553 domain-containing protein [Isosphaeraceae bacterium]|nr:DUF1553 domain-containing protein [Isosphaeraceae bacterium]
MTLLRICVAFTVVCGFARVAQAADLPTFERDVRPIFKAYCLDCHGAGDKIEGELDLRLRRFAARGGISGPAIEPGDPEASYLVMRLKDGEMPPGEKKVPAEQIAAIERWIAQGAPTLRDEPESLPPGIDITPEERAFWAFQPIQRPEPPDFGPEDRVRTPIDAFLLARLRERGLSFAPEADRITLIRRASVDLTGLPPSREEIDAFLKDSSPDSYERMIDHLLASSHYGEHWARHWLDVAGYADSDGNGSDDTPRPYAYKYRDYVIRAINRDLPLDQFVIEQLAGDELVSRPWKDLTPEQVEKLAATGFLRTSVDGTSTRGADLALTSNQVVADTLQIVSSTFLGLTVACARCHDHKYDPIPQADYYRMRAIFEPALDPQHWRKPSQRLVSLATDAERARSAEIEAEAQKLQTALDEKTRKFVDAAREKELEKFPEDQRAVLREASQTPAAKRTDEQKALLADKPSLNISAGTLYQYDKDAADELKKDREAIAAKRAEKPVEDFVSVLDEPSGDLPVTHLFHRGDHRQPTKPVGPGGLTIAAPEGQRFEIPPDDPSLATSGRRLAYARHLTSGTHPLVGRVLVNRIWLHHFGRGLVDSPGDLGFLGQRPTHPALLDWLADELVRQGWSLKQMHRLIMTSTAYRQSSQRQSAHDAIDSGNTLYARYPVRRLNGESLRDHILFVSGRLDTRLFGPPVPVSEDAVGQVAPADNSARRSLYLQVRRSEPVSFLDAFDAPLMAVNCERRTSTTSAPQALVLMNSDFVRDHARTMALRVIAEAPQVSDPSSESDDPAETPWSGWIGHAWELAYQRPISDAELVLARAFVADQLAALGQEGEADERHRAVLTNLCQQLLSSNEFLYVD